MDMLSIEEIKAILNQSRNELVSALDASNVPDATRQSTVIKAAFDVAMKKLENRKSVPVQA